jgi:hypothetical protein
MSIQIGETQYSPLSSLHAHPQSTCLVITINNKSLKTRSRTLQFSLLPNSTVSSTHTGFTSFQSFHTPASSILMATSHIILPNPLLFLTRARLRPPHHCTNTGHITRCRHRRCQPQQPQRQTCPPSLPHDTPESAHLVTDKTIPSAARTKAILYLGQNGGRPGGIGDIRIRRPPSRDAVGMGRGSHEWAGCWKR